MTKLTNLKQVEIFGTISNNLLNIYYEIHSYVMVLKKWQYYTNFDDKCISL